MKYSVKMKNVVFCFYALQNYFPVHGLRLFSSIFVALPLFAVYLLPGRCINDVQTICAINIIVLISY